MPVARTVRELACDHLLPLDDADGGVRARRPTVSELMGRFEGFDAESRQRAYAIAVRRVALQLLYELDARSAVRARAGDADPQEETLIEDVLGALDSMEGLGPIGAERVGTLVRGAWRGRDEADEIMGALAPQWPASRQPAVDRALLRLAFYEMRSGLTPARIVINEAVELAKRFSTEKSPPFVNGLLGKAMRGIDPVARGSGSLTGSAASGDEGLAAS